MRIGPQQLGLGVSKLGPQQNSKAGFAGSFKAAKFSIQRSGAAVSGSGSSTKGLASDGVAAQSKGAASASTRARVNELMKQLRGMLGSTSKPTQTAIDAAVQEISALTGSGLTLGGPENAVVSGANPRQVAAVDVQALKPSSTLLVRGEVTQAAGAASLRVLGGSGATATAGGRYELVGSAGRVAIDVSAGESLYGVAARINQSSARVGVSASVTGNDIVLASVGTGQSARVQFRQIAEEGPAATGVDPQQVTAFSVQQIASGASETITGEVLSSAQHAQLDYIGGAGGVVTGTAAFRLTGGAGSTVVSVTEGESLDAVASRVNLLTPSTGVTANVQGDRIELTSAAVGSSASVNVEILSLAEEVTTSGVNVQQITDLDIVSLEAGSEHTLSGRIVRSAANAELTLLGEAGGVVADSATFELSGSLGTESISIVGGESLAGVAGRVNALSGSTGVSAQVSGDTLVFKSLDVGSDANLAINLTSVAHHTQVSGVNAQQVTAFAVQSFTDGGSQQLTGSVTQTASKAELTFTGFLGLAFTTANITVTGSIGSHQFSVGLTESLSALANKINQQTGATGVAATVQGNTLKFQSSGVGSAATVGIHVNSGAFNVQGGDGHGADSGDNGRAVVNGQTITGAGNQFTYSDSLGSYTFTAAAGFTGTFSPVSIASQAGDFALTGGAGDGTSAGLDGIAEINGVTLNGTGNRYAFTEAGGEFDLEFAADFEGAFDPVTIRSDVAEVTLSGGDGAGTAHGADAVAVIQGQQRTGVGNRFDFAGEHGSYSLTFGQDFEGEFDPIYVASRSGSLQTAGGNGAGRAVGSDATARINGRELTGSGSRFDVSENGVQAAIEFAAGFEGEFDPLTITGKAVFEGGKKSELAALGDQVAQLSSGGDLQDDAAAAMALLEALVEQLADPQAAAAAPEEPEAAPRISPRLAQAQVIAQQFAKLGAAVSASRSIDQQNLALIQRLVDLKA